MIRIFHRKIEDPKKDLGIIEQEVNDFMLKNVEDMPVRDNIMFGDTLVCIVFYKGIVKKAWQK